MNDHKPVGAKEWNVVVCVRKVLHRLRYLSTWSPNSGHTCRSLGGTALTRGSTSLGVGVGRLRSHSLVPLPVHEYGWGSDMRSQLPAPATMTGVCCYTAQPWWTFIPVDLKAKINFYRLLWPRWFMTAVETQLIQWVFLLLWLKQGDSLMQRLSKVNQIFCFQGKLACLFPPP